MPGWVLTCQKQLMFHDKARNEQNLIQTRKIRLCLKTCTKRKVCCGVDRERVVILKQMDESAEAEDDGD